MTEDQLEKVHECLLNLNIRIINIQEVRLELLKLKIPFESPVYHDIMLNSFVKIASVNDELSRLNHMCKDNQYLRDVFYCLEPLLRVVNSYEGGVRSWRNSIVAHLNRDKMQQFKPFWGRLEGIVPLDANELNLLWEVLDMVRVILLNRFPLFMDYHNRQHEMFMKQMEANKDKIRAVDWSVKAQAIMRETNKRMAERKF